MIESTALIGNVHLGRAGVSRKVLRIALRIKLIRQESTFGNTSQIIGDAYPYRNQQAIIEFPLLTEEEPV